MSTQEFVLILILIAAILLAGGAALFTGFRLSKRENALALIALVVAPTLTVITTLANILVTFIKGALAE